MLKKYLITFFCFLLTHSVLAQLQSDLSIFVKRLNTLASMLTGKIVSPFQIPHDVSPLKFIEMPSSGGVVIKAPPSGGQIKVFSGSVLVVTFDAHIQFPSSGSIDVNAGDFVKIPDDGIVMIIPKKVTGSIPGGIVPPADMIILSSSSVVIEAPTSGGNIPMPSAGGVVVVPFDAKVTLPDGTVTQVASGAFVKVSQGGVVQVTPQGSGTPSTTPRNVKNVLKVVANVTQLHVPDITDAQALSGYVSVYYSFGELLRADNKDIVLSFDNFMQLALRSIKKRRIQVACRNYIANILTKPPYLRAEDNLPVKTPGFDITSERVRRIYHSLLSDLAGVVAEKYVQDRYTISKTAEKADSLNIAKYILHGKTLIKDLKDEVVDKRREYYIKEFKVSSATLSALIDQKEYLKEYAHIDETTKIEFNATQILSELHQPSSFSQEEGSGGQTMPTGRWLQSGDVAHLMGILGDISIVKAMGLSDVLKPGAISDNISIFDNLGLLEVPQEKILAARIEIQENYYINQQILGRVVREERNNVHTFIVNAGYYFGHENKPDQFRWIMIVRYPDNNYSIVDAQNADRTKDVNLKIIQEEFAKPIS